MRISVILESLRPQVESFGIIGIVTMTVLLLGVSPIHSHIVRREAEINRLCGDDRLYFEGTKKCYSPYKNGPCGELLLKPSLSNAEGNIGICDCPEFFSGNNSPDRPKVLWEEESRCYPIYHQGPCKEGEWLVPKNNSNGSSCKRIPCPDKYRALVQEDPYSASSLRFVFPHEGKCYLTFSSDSNHFCRPDESLVFIENDKFNFHCNPLLPVQNSSDAQGISPETDCVDGSKPDFQGACEPLTVL